MHKDWVFGPKCLHFFNFCSFLVLVVKQSLENGHETHGNADCGLHWQELATKPHQYQSLSRFLAMNPNSHTNPPKILSNLLWEVEGRNNSTQQVPSSTWIKLVVGYLPVSTLHIQLQGGQIQSAWDPGSGWHPGHAWTLESQANNIIAKEICPNIRPTKPVCFCTLLTEAQKMELAQFPLLGHSLKSVVERRQDQVPGGDP